MAFPPDDERAAHLLQCAVFEVAYSDGQLLSTAAMLAAQAIDAAYTEWGGLVTRLVDELGVTDGMNAQPIGELLDDLARAR
jgi:hypothetical protein